jgi:hypothetical protein
MAEFDINLGEVKFKPPLTPGDYTFAILKASVEQAKEPNKRSGEREWMIKAELKPLEVEGYVVFHIWSLSQAALEVENPAISLKKLYQLANWPVGDKINSDDLLSFKIVGHTKLESFNGRLNPKLETILSVTT